MRLWSFCPSHLDDFALRRLWRDGLLALRILKGERPGRAHDRQLDRWREHGTPILALTDYLWAVHRAAARHGRKFDARLLSPLPRTKPVTIPVRAGQVAAEFQLFLNRLRRRDIQEHEARRAIAPKPASPFHVVPGELEPWEKELAP